MNTKDFLKTVNDEFEIETLELMKGVIDKRIRELNDLLNVANPRKVVHGFRRDLVTPEELAEMIREIVREEKKKGIDGKACWKGYRYAGTENGKDKCVPIRKK